MLKLTKEQRHALKRIYDRTPLDANTDRMVPGLTPLTYRQFRQKVVGEIGGWGAVLVPWCGMWLGIEKDGYTHS